MEPLRPAHADLLTPVLARGYGRMASSMTAPNLSTLQIGNDWFGERQGGLNRVYLELSRHLPEAGVAFRGLVAGGPRAAAESGGAVTGFAPVQASLPSRLLRARDAVRKEMAAHRPDLVASHFALYTFPALGQLRGTPLVVHFHGPWAAEAGVEGQQSFVSRMQAALERTVYRRAKAFIVLSEAFRGELVRRYRVPENQVHIAPGGVDTERFGVKISRHAAREALGWPTDRPILLAVRRQMKRMGLETLVDAVAAMRSRVPDVLLMLGGTGPLQQELRERIAAQGLGEHVRQLGRIDDADLPVAYRAADLSVVPTQALEGFGMITLESLASGTPVVTTPVGGLPEVVRPFAPQCVLPDTSVEAMTERLTELLLGTEKLPEDLACREYAQSRFAWPVIAVKTRRVYEGVLA